MGHLTTLRRFAATGKIPFHAIILASLIVSVCGIIEGDPPAFLPDGPEDQFVFEVDDDGDPVSLIFQCPVSGSGPPSITWYREGEVDEQYITEDGDYIFPNINSTHMEYASGEGVEYYCTASNEFGIIRSHPVKAFYASFAGFVEDVPATQEVHVINADETVLDQTIALECALNPGSIPKPMIEWYVVNEEGDETLLESSSEVYFVDDGEWLILKTDSDAITGKTYFCQVTNKLNFLTEQAPTNYTLNAVEQFDDGLRIYRQLTNKSVKKVDLQDVQQSDRVLFGTGIAYNEDYTREWTVDGSANRVISNGPVAYVAPSFLPDDESNPLEVKLTLSVVGSDETDTLTAYLLLLEPAMITSSPSDMKHLLANTDVTFTCEVTGEPQPNIIWYFNGELVEGDNINEGTLTITSATTSNSGMYQCLAINLRGSQSRSWTAQIRDPLTPEVTDSFQVPPAPFLGYPVVQQTDAPVNLFVELTADPCPDVEWFFNGVQITEANAAPPDNTSNITLFTFTDGCVNYEVGDTQFTFSLVLNVLNGHTIGYYSVNFTNVGGEKAIPAHLVTTGVFAGFGEITVDPNVPVVNANNIFMRTQWVALQCPINPGSIPQPAIQWFRENSGGETVLIEDTLTNNIRFLDDKEWLILRTVNDVIVDTEYFCRVSCFNEKSPFTYALDAVTDQIFRIYRQLENKSAPLMDFDDVQEDDTILFGTAFSYNGNYIRQWRVNNKDVDVRLYDMEAIASIAPSFLDDDDTNPIEIKMVLTEGPNQEILTAYLHLEFGPTLTESPSGGVRNLLTGASVTYTCKATGGPPPTITWLFQGETLVGDAQRIIEGGTLTINSAIEEDSGLYQCVAKNPFGSQTASITLNFREPVPINVMSSFAVDRNPCVELPELQVNVLVVELMADPCPTAQWYLNDVPITEETGDITLADDCKNPVMGGINYTFSLTINTFTEATQGVYRVDFDNGYGTESISPHRVSSKVDSVVSDLTVDLVNVIDGTNYCITTGSTFNMDCVFMSYPYPTVQFLKNNVPITLSDRVIQDCDGLTVSGVVADDDQGMYQCRVYLDDPSKNSTSVARNLVLCSEPTFVAELQFSTSTPKEGTGVMANCQWSGIPKPSLVWSRDGENLKVGTRITIEETDDIGGGYMSELHIKTTKLDDSGKYTCTINNLLATVTSTKELEVKRSSGTRLGLSHIGVAIAVGVSLLAMYITQCL